MIWHENVQKGSICAYSLFMIQGKNIPPDIRGKFSLITLEADDSAVLEQRLQVLGSTGSEIKEGN